MMRNLFHAQHVMKMWAIPSSKPTARYRSMRIQSLDQIIDRGRIFWINENGYLFNFDFQKHVELLCPSHLVLSRLYIMHWYAYFFQYAE